MTTRQRIARRPVVVKLGGELLEDKASRARLARLIARAGKGARLVIVHGGGKEIDAAMAQAGIPKRQVDGIRVTDDATLQVVVAVLAGSINTRFVAAINAAGGKALGLTGADAGVGLVRRASPFTTTTGERVDLGFVGEPLPASNPALVNVLVRERFVPVIACIGASRDGSLYNVNADTFAAHLAGRLGATRLVIAGATSGVLDESGATIAALDGRGVSRMVKSGTVTAGMIAKLRACHKAGRNGVRDVVIANGRDVSRLSTFVSGGWPPPGTWTRVSA